ncbi:MAG: CHASE domain-containing protein [Rhodospirillum sp.]|nr:CHASE domain-containing protein [Rhodospirillum sp.]MCF8491939.1 CHASE domain-containing protein [Rhodospirillum sp.]MCF8501087.1 CHASE domain-containing protein [Rhodospirillum sp.]
MSVILVVARSEHVQSLREERTEILRDLALLRAGLEREITIASSLGSVLMADVAITGHMDSKRFDLLSREILAGSRVLRHVGLSEGMVVRWVSPLAGNESAIGLNYRDVPAQLKGVLKAIDIRSTVLAGPLTLAQGTQALVVRRPIFLSPPNRMPRSGPFWGILSLVLRTDTLFRGAGLLEPDLPMMVALRHAGSTDPKAVFLGSADLFADPEAVILPVSLPEGQWDLVGRPKGGWGKRDGSGPEPLVFFGTLLALIAGAAAFGGVTWLDRKREAERAMRDAKIRAEQVLDELTKARAELAQAERLSSLGALVESVTHEVSNPLGASLTAATFLEEATQDLEKRFHGNTLRRQDMEEFLGNARRVSDVTARNLTRAAQLIESFKQVAVDQASDARRSLDLRSWLEDVRVSLTPRLNRTHHVLEVHCPDGVIMDTRPGALFQVITLLVIGALDTVGESKARMVLRLSVTVETGNKVALVFQDESLPLAPEDMAVLTEGGVLVGGGAHRGFVSCRSLVTGPLMGSLSGRSGTDRGNTLVIRLPRVLPV